MKKSILITLILFTLLVVSCATQTATPAPTPQPSVALNLNSFPLAKGAYWVYEGPVKWQEESGVKEETFTWKMEVVDVIERDNVTGYLMKGNPADLTWYERGRTPSDYVIVKVGPKYYRSDDIAVWDRLKDPTNMLGDLVGEGQLFLDLPLWKDKFFGETSQFTRPDTYYHWIVETEQPAQLTAKGVTGTDKPTQYTLAFRSAPDHQLVDFVPGIGITHYLYSHHGTISDVDVKLTEYHPGE